MGCGLLLGQERLISFYDTEFFSMKEWMFLQRNFPFELLHMDNLLEVTQLAFIELLLGVDEPVLDAKALVVRKILPVLVCLANCAILTCLLRASCTFLVDVLAPEFIRSCYKRSRLIA